jgi:hypothetical protein
MNICPKITRKATATLLLAMLLGLAATVPAGAGAGEFKIARLKYRGGGDWYSDPTSLPNLLKGAGEVLGIRTAKEEVRLSIMDEALFTCPFAYITGHGKVKFSEAEATRLRLYLASGGFLWADDNYGMDEYFGKRYERSFRSRSWWRFPSTTRYIIWSMPSRAACPRFMSITEARRAVTGLSMTDGWLFSIHIIQT